MKLIPIAAAAALLLSSLDSRAGPTRTDLLAGGDHGHGRGHHASRHAPAEYRQHRHDDARRYAAVAIRQAHKARALGYYPDHPRWSLNFQRHYRWALHADAYRIEREIRRRARKLRELRRHARHQYGYPH